MSKTSLKKYKKLSPNSKLYKKGNKRIPAIDNSAVAFASKFRGINPHATWGTTEGDDCISSAMRCATYKKGSGVKSSSFDGGWGTRWW